MNRHDPYAWDHLVALAHQPTLDDLRFTRREPEAQAAPAPIVHRVAYVPTQDMIDYRDGFTLGERGQQLPPMIPEANRERFVQGYRDGLESRFQERHP